MTGEEVKIGYGDVAPEAKENFVPSASDRTDFSDLSQLQKYNLQFENYANPCEYGSVLLDRSTLPFPKTPESENIGLWSGSISDEEGNLQAPIVLTLESTAQYSSQGLTLTFDTYNNIFCNDLNIRWYRNGEQIESADFLPNSAFYFCRKQVQNYDKAVITFKSLNMPYNRLKLRAIDYGYGTYFYGDELRGVKLIQELDPISSEISINTVDFTLDSKSDMEYSFQSKQPLSVYSNGALMATTFVKSSKRKSKCQWEINSEDYIGQLDKLTFMGGMYTGKNASELLASIFTQAKIPFSISSDFSTKTVTGYIPICTCREALRQICFAIGAVVNTSNSDKVNVYALPDTPVQTIALGRIRQGQSFDDGERVTEVQLTQHSYIENTEDKIEAYKAEDSGTGENILVKFSSPMHDLSITSGTIHSSGANYAIITANSRCVLSGYGYDDNTTVKSKRNPVISASDLENIVEITDATLITQDNSSEVLERIYPHLIKVNTVNLSIVEGRRRLVYGEAKYDSAKYNQWLYDSKVNAGDIITTETEYLGTLTGRIISARFNLNGGIIVKECELM